jgi:hypothetical protein
MVTIVALALAKGVAWSVVLPPWYGPDEPSHYAYVQELVENGWLASGNDADAAIYYPHEILCSESKMDFGIFGPFDAEPPWGTPPSACSASSPADRLASSPINPASNYSPVYYAPAVAFYLLARPLSVEARLDAVRLWSVLLGVLAAAFAYLAARWAFPDSPSMSLAVAVLFALQPMNSQQTAVVNNDALLIAVAAVFWWRFFYGLRKGVSTREWLLLGSLVGLAYLAKPQGLFLATALPVLYFVAAKPPMPGHSTLGFLARLGTAAGVPIVAAIGIGQVLSLLAGKTTALIPSAPGIHGISQYLEIYSWYHFERLYIIWITSFWGYFGWFQVDMPSAVYVVISVAVALGIAGAAWLAVRSRPLRPIVVASMLAFLLPAALIQLLEAYTFKTNGQLILQGRSFLMVLLPLLILLMRGWRALIPAGAGWLLAPAVVLAGVGLNLIGLLAMVDSFYG